VGCIELLVNNGRYLVLWRSIFLHNFTYVAFGQRLAKDYDERTVVIYNTGNGRLLVELEYINKQKIITLTNKMR
jgi:hypothetical protein